MSDLLHGLVSIVGTSGVIAEPTEMEGYTSDWFGRFKGRAAAVILPRNTEDVSRIVALCARTGTRIVPQGGNTSVCGGSVPDMDGPQTIVLSLSRMNSIRTIDTETNAIVVDAGCILSSVQDIAQSAGRTFPLSLSAEGSCQIGGTISTNAGGTNVLRYGTMRDLVLGLEVVLPDGKVWDGLKTVRKDSSGYDLKGLWIGAEGTLGIITAAALKLFPTITDRATALVAVANPKDALRLLARMREEFDTLLTAFELMSSSQIEMVYQLIPGAKRPIEGRFPWYILLEIASGKASANLGNQLERCMELALEDGEVQDAVVAKSDSQAQALWHVRHAITEALKIAGVSLTHDVAVPLSKVPGYIDFVDAEISLKFPRALKTVVCHLGDGNVHFNVTFQRQEWEVLDEPESRAHEISDIIQDAAMSLGGTFVAEHGIGQKFRSAAARYKSPVESGLAHAIKNLLDPTGIMNPGRTIPST